MFLLTLSHTVILLGCCLSDESLTCADYAMYFIVRYSWWHLKVWQNVNLVSKKEFPFTETLILSLINSNRSRSRQKTVLIDIDCYKVTKGSKMRYFYRDAKHGNTVIMMFCRYCWLFILSFCLFILSNIKSKKGNMWRHTLNIPSFNMSILKGRKAFYAVYFNWVREK